MEECAADSARHARSHVKCIVLEGAKIVTTITVTSRMVLKTVGVQGLVSTWILAESACVVIGGSVLRWGELRHTFMT